MWLNTVLPLQKDASPKANAEPGTKPLPQNALSSTLQALQNLNPLSRPSPDVAEVSAPETGRLFVVSNRLPFSVKAGEKPGDYEFVMSSGGLVSAMLGVMKDDSMTWVGWPGVSADAESERTTIREQLAEHKCVPVFLDEQTADEYYNGFCNSVLWPLFHYVVDVLDTSPLQTQWSAYVRANEAFAAELLEMVQEGDTVWVHDYHLMLVPTLLKSRMPSLRIGWFLHTPFPTSEVFRMLPMRDQLMRGLVGADLLGFHTSEYMRHFLQSAQRIMGNDASATFAANTLSLRIPRALGPAGATATAGSMAPGGLAEEAELPAPAVATPTATPLQPPLTAELVDAVNAAADTAEVAADVGAHDFAHTVHTGAFPIGIDPERFTEHLKKKETQAAIRALQERFGGRKIMLGIDRLDPIKGIPHKLLAFEALLEAHPEYASEVVLVQIAVPSRLDVPLHQQLQKRLHLLVGRINGRFGTLGSTPIHYLDTSVSFDELVALYAASSAMVISSLRDGMNLVSFEWTICQQHKPRPWQSPDAADAAGDYEGVLILSEFAGAADHLDEGALLVNPHDTHALAEAMHEALSMPLGRRRELHKNAVDFVTTSTASTWAAKFVATLNRLHASNGLLPDASATMQPLLAMLAQQPRLALLTDYDGTLTPIVPDPEAAQIADDALAGLQRLAALVPTAIVSGRSRAKIDSFVGLDELWVAGSHGFDIAGPAGVNVRHRPAEEYRPALAAAASSISLELAALEGALVEDNDFAVSVHYRHVAEEDLPAVEAAVERALASQPSLARFPGKKVVELRPDMEWHKGKAVEFILAQMEQSAGGPVFPIYLGDDVADEDAFAAVRARGGLAILVSDSVVARDQTAATYRLRSPKHVHKLLAKLSSMLPPALE